MFYPGAPAPRSPCGVPAGCRNCGTHLRSSNLPDLKVHRPSSRSAANGGISAQVQSPHRCSLPRLSFQADTAKVLHTDHPRAPVRMPVRSRPVLLTPADSKSHPFRKYRKVEKCRSSIFIAASKIRSAFGRLLCVCHDVLNTSAKRPSRSQFRTPCPP